MMKRSIFTKDYRLYLFFVLMAYIGALFWQLFLPQLANTYTTWGSNIYWQREIALWNIGMIVVVIIALKSNNHTLQWVTTLQSTILCAVLGFNHLLSLIIFLDFSAFIHILGVVEVLLLGGGWGFLLLFNHKNMFFEIMGKHEFEEKRK